MQAKPRVPVVFFDGYCNLCNRTVLFIIRNDRKGTLRFASLQSDYGCEVLNQPPHQDIGYSTLILLEDGKEYYRSEAALRISRYLKGPWKFLWYMSYIPRRLRDIVYNIVARLRYSVFGRRDNCMVPPHELRSRFLDE